MPKLVVTAQVEDAVKWEAGLRTRGDLFKSLTVTAPVDFAINEGNEVAVYCEPANLETFMTGMDGPTVAEAMAQTEAVCEQLHLPLQSGSDRILSAMHRGYTGRRFLEKLAMARDIIPGLATSTDIIVGFPGETEADFRATLDVIAEARFDSAFMFIYSPRPGTPAADMNDQVPREVSGERFARLTTLQRRISLERNQTMVGRTVEVLTEGPSKKDPSFATGRTRTNKIVHLAGDYPTGTFVDVTITHAAPHHLMGRALVRA